MTPLRRRMIEDMQIRNLAPRTQTSYVEQVDRFARHFRKSPERLGTAEIRAWQLYLAQDKRLAASSISLAVAALRFLYTVTLRREWTIKDDIPTCRKPHQLPEVLSPARGCRFPGCGENPEAAGDFDRLLRGGVTYFRSGPAEASRHRQPADGHPCGGGQRAERSLRDVVAAAIGHSARLLENRPAKGVAVPGQAVRGADHDVCC